MVIIIVIIYGVSRVDGAPPQDLIAASGLGGPLFDRGPTTTTTTTTTTTAATTTTTTTDDDDDKPTNIYIYI